MRKVISLGADSPFGVRVCEKVDIISLILDKSYCIYSINAVYAIVTGRELIKLLRKHGWQLDRVAGSHHIMKKQEKTLTIPVHGKKDLPKGTPSSILKEAGAK